MEVGDSVLSCSQTGLVRTPVDGSPPIVLDSGPCYDILGPDVTPAREVWFMRGVGPGSDENVYGVLLDGSAPTWVAFAADGDKQLLGPIVPIGARDPFFTRTPPGTYAQGSDGWLDDWQFMQRGISPSVSIDGTRLRWLEDAARFAPVGDLDSALIDTHEVLHVARNVRQYEELSPGRLLVADDQPYVAVQNRILVVDEQARTARHYADAADQFHVLRGADGAPTRLLVERVDDAGLTSLGLAPLP